MLPPSCLGCQGVATLLQGPSGYQESWLASEVITLQHMMHGLLHAGSQKHQVFRNLHCSSDSRGFHMSPPAQLPSIRHRPMKIYLVSIKTHYLPLPSIQAQ